MEEIKIELLVCPKCSGEFQKALTEQKWHFKTALIVMKDALATWKLWH